MLISTSIIASSSDNREFKDMYLKDYPESKKISNCTLCHQKGGKISLNPYGHDYEESDYDFNAIERLDSDNDGIINIDEIKNGTLPGFRN